MPQIISVALLAFTLIGCGNVTDQQQTNMPSSESEAEVANEKRESLCTAEEIDNLFKSDCVYSAASVCEDAEDPSECLNEEAKACPGWMRCFAEGNQLPVCSPEERDEVVRSECVYAAARVCEDAEDPSECLDEEAAQCPSYRRCILSE